MIAFEAVLRQVRGLESATLVRWIEARWVLPERVADAYLFHDIDVARVHLIVDLTQELRIDEEAMPVVLNLLDQVYALRKRLTSLARAIDALPPDLQARIRDNYEE